MQMGGVMFDIETLGRSPGSIILSIGACRFSCTDKTIFDEFYTTIDIEDSKKYGLTHDKETLDWWKEQNPAAIRNIQKDALTAKDALLQFRVYLGKFPNAPLWAWGTNFDVPVVEVAMRKVLGITQMPWKYYKVCDARTLSMVFGRTIDRSEGIHHNALDDAKAQAKFIIDLLGNVE